MSGSVYDSWVDGNVIYVRDLCNEVTGARSVTNDAEHVVKQVVRLHGDMRVMYYDSDGNLDELVHHNGEFTGFAPGPR